VPSISRPPAPVLERSPVVSAINKTEFCINLPVVVSNLAAALSVAEPGPTTSPLPEGVTQVPSPLQKVVAEAPVPLFKLPTGRFPVTPVVRGKPVQFVRTPEAGVPKAGVTKVGEVANTNAPLPVSLVTAVAKLAEEGVARKVATPVPSPDIPVATGKPVALVRVAAEGVPRLGVTNVGEVANTLEPEPVSSVSIADILADEGVPKKVATPVPNPETPVDIGRPVALVKVPDVGVPRIGVTRVGLVAKTRFPEPVSFVTAVAKFAEVGVPKKVAIPAANPETPVDMGRPVAFVRVPEAGVPSTGVVITGAVNVLLVRVSVPVNVAKSSSLSAVLNCALVPVNVLLVKFTVLLVRVSAPARVAKSLSVKAVLN